MMLLLPSWQVIVHRPQLYRKTGRISAVNILSLDVRVWRLRDMVPKALLAALILAATSSADPSNDPRSFTSFHDKSDFVTVRYWVLFLFSWRLSSVNIGSHLFTSCSTSCRSLQWRVVNACWKTRVGSWLRFQSNRWRLHSVTPWKAQ